MKRVLGWAIAATALGLVLGILGGIQAHRSASLSAEIQAGLAIMIGCNLLFCLWMWYRAKPGSGDAMVAPGIAMLSASMLVGILPRVIWPAAEGVQIAGSIASIVAVAALLIFQLRRRRRLRSGL